MRGRLLIINLRGFKRFDQLYQELASLGWKTRVLDFEEPAFPCWAAAARSFSPSLERWRRNLQQTIGRMARTAWAFKYKSRLCRKMIERSRFEYDLVLQAGGMFAPSWPLPENPYALFRDCTVKLGEGEPLSGVDFASESSAARWYALERALYRKAGCIFAASDYVRRSLIEDYGARTEQVLVVGEGFNVKAPDPLNKQYDGKTILYVGYEFQRKGGEVLLAAFERVAATIEGAELLIAGPRRIGRPLPAGARLLGPVSRQELARLYARASIFVMPSLFEPFGLVFLEAMEHKLPCIGSDRCAIPEIIADGQTGLIAPAGDANALAEEIIDLLRRPEIMRLMGERGRERARRLFTWHAVARRMDEKLVELLGSAKGARRACLQQQA